MIIRKVGSDMNLRLYFLDNKRRGRRQAKRANTSSMGRTLVAIIARLIRLTAENDELALK
jgi:hypothetical protein